MAERRDTGSLIEFTRKCAIALLLTGLALLTYMFAHVLLLIFGAALVSILLASLGEPIARWTRLPYGIAVVAALLLVLAVLAACGWLFGSSMAGQVSQLRTQIPAGIRSLETWLGGQALGQQALASLREAVPDTSALAERVGALVSTIGSALANLVVVIFAGVYLALSPTTYVLGIAKLVPKDRHDQLLGALTTAGEALRLWLLGQLAAMLLVGLLTGIGLWLVGVPSPLALGLIAGLTEFVPIVGPVVAAIPGILIALSVDPGLAVYALLVYVGVQQIEGNLITPLVVRHAVALPPALTLLGVLAMGVLFGPLGVVLSAPLVVFVFVLVKRVYVREMLGYSVEVPGEK